MATIRIADASHPKDERPWTNLQDGVRSSGGDGIYGRRSFSRSDAAGPHDDIYNIRSRSKPPSANRRSSRMSMTDREDDDPGLRKPGDFKQKQVPTEPIANLCDLRSFWVGIQGEVASVACLSINRSHLW
jgi:KUP system potassium uptake protein